MRELISDKIAQASTKRTAPMVAEGSPPPEARPEPKAVAKVETAPEPKWPPRRQNRSRVRKTEANSREPRTPRRGSPVASAVSLPVRLNSAPAGSPIPPTARPESMAAAAQPRTAAGSTDPIRPVLVKTLDGEGGHADRVARPDAGIRAGAVRTCAGSARPRRWRRPRRVVAASKP